MASQFFYKFQVSSKGQLKAIVKDLLEVIKLMQMVD